MKKKACVAVGLLLFAGSVQAQDASPESRPVIDLAPHPYDGKRAVAVFHGFTGHQVHTTSDGGGTWTRWAAVCASEFSIPLCPVFRRCR